jgi:hypothetical protein
MLHLVPSHNQTGQGRRSGMDEDLEEAAETMEQLAFDIWASKEEARRKRGDPFDARSFEVL